MPFQVGLGKPNGINTIKKCLCNCRIVTCASLFIITGAVKEVISFICLYDIFCVTGLWEEYCSLFQ